MRHPQRLLRAGGDEADLLVLVLREAELVAELLEHVVRDHRRHEERAGLRHRLRRLLVEQVAVLDAVHSGLDAVGDALRVVGVREDVRVAGARLFDGGAQLLDGELRSLDRVRRRGCAAGSHHLELSRATPELIACGLAHLVRAVAEHGAADQPADALLEVVDVRRPVVAVAARLRQKRPAGQDARPADHAARDDASPRRIEAAGVAYGREPLVERLLDEAHDLDRVGGEWPRDLSVALREPEMEVGVRQAGEQVAAAGVDDRPIAPLEGVVRGDARDAPVLDAHGDARPGIGTSAVDQRGVVDQQRGHGPIIREAGASVKRGAPLMDSRASP